MDYFHTYQSIEDLKVFELAERLKNCQKLQLKEIKFSDILYNIESLVGVYIFYDENNNAMYVGKTEGRSFLERLAAHFDLRHQGYMNHLLKALTGKPRGKNSPIQNEDLIQAYHLLINFGICFISLYDKEKIRKVEIVLRQELKPVYNRYSSKQILDSNRTLKSL